MGTILYKLRRQVGAPPMYAQIAAFIEKDLVSGRFKTGEFLPSELALSRSLAVSRATVTKAYQVLENRHLVAKMQGSGTQVAQMPMERSIIEFTGFSQHVKQLGRKPESKLISFREGLGGGESDVENAYRDGLELIIVERMRLVDGVPQGIQLVAINKSIADTAGINKKSLAQRNASLYELLSGAGIVLESAEETLIASNATVKECSAMNLPKHTPMFEVFRKSFDHSGQVIEAVKARYLGSSYIYKVQLGARPGLSQ